MSSVCQHDIQQLLHVSVFETIKQRKETLSETTEWRHTDSECILHVNSP